jgi:hypothetical protein
MSAPAIKYQTCINKAPAKENACMTGFDHGAKKMSMVPEMAEGANSKDYGEGYKAGREFAHKQTGSRRRKYKRYVRKTRRNKNVNGRK